MPNLDPATRARLADALEGATPERLAEYASHCVELVALCGEGDPRIQTFNTLAALALAVAEMQERQDGVRVREVIVGGRRETEWRTWTRDWNEVTARTLPSALAALLRTSEGA